MSALFSPPSSPWSHSRRGAYDSMNNDESARYRRELLDVLGSLRSLGLTQVLELPQIALIGSQSSGKSSLIEALCQIKLPRAIGTCTRCPIECRSQYADHPWKAQVFLRIEQGDQEDRSRWEEEIPFGDPIDDPELIEDLIRRAQLAVLHPRVDPAVFLQGDREPGGGLSFTKNCVVVKLAGQELSDLSFVDLPGIISSTVNDQSIGDIKLVRRLISSYMSRKSTINLVVITCEADYETQAAGLLAKRYDPTGERTIGVLTKPDRIEDQQEPQWTRFVTGEFNPLKNGWYCVKQPGATERESGLSWDGARRLESEFFDGAPGWSAITGESTSRLGSQNLALKLGQVLSSAIQKRLPGIRTEIDNLIRSNNSELSKLPIRCPSGARDFVQRLVTKFVRDVEKQMIKGDPGAGDKGVVQSIRGGFEDLREYLQEAAPVFLPDAREGSGPTELPRPGFLPPDEQWLSRSPTGNEHTIDAVAKFAKGSRTREWPGHYPFQVMLDYMAMVVERWRQPVQLSFDKARVHFETKLIELVERHFATYSYGGLPAEVRRIAWELVEKCQEDTSEALAKDLDQELNPESTHEDLYLAYENHFSDYYRDFFGSSTGLKQLGEALVMATHPELRDAITLLERFGLPQILPEEWQRIHPLGISEKSTLRIMASVRAHYQIAYKRFADKVKETVDQSYVRAFGDQIEDVLRRGLGLNSGDTPESQFEEFVRESEETEILRSDLKDKVQRLYTAKIKLA